MTGIDASVEIVHELDRLAQNSVVAELAPRSTGLYANLARGTQAGDIAHEFMDLTNKLIEKLGIWWSPQGYSRLPVMVPWCVRDRSCRYDQGPESWGAPRADGYFPDDNSIIKKLPLSCVVLAPHGHPYHGRKPWRGFTACHIWRDLPDGTLAGADPWLYSFMPNLVWLPSWLAPLTDRQASQVQHTLQRTSIALFREVEMPSQLRSYAERSWSKLPEPPSGYTLPIERLAMFDPHEKFFRNRINYLDKIVAGTNSILTGGSLPAKLICSRYTAGLPQLSATTISQFRNAIGTYRDTVVGTMRVTPEPSAGVTRDDEGELTAV